MGVFVFGWLFWLGGKQRRGIREGIFVGVMMREGPNQRWVGGAWSWWAMWWRRQWYLLGGQWRVEGVGWWRGTKLGTGTETSTCLWVCLMIWNNSNIERLGLRAIPWLWSWFLLQVPHILGLTFSLLWLYPFRSATDDDSNLKIYYFLTNKIIQLASKLDPTKLFLCILPPGLFLALKCWWSKKIIYTTLTWIKLKIEKYY